MRFLMRVLLIFFVVSALLSILRGAFSTSQQQRPRRPASNPEPEPERERVASGHLVKDPVCGTYVLENTAIRAGDAFFCSEDCRQKYRI